jgi:CRISPR-associated endonuclease/helicase Cas3
LDDFLQFWAKSGRQDDTAPMHSIAHHSCDVAACTAALLETFPPPPAVPAGALVALVACHDIGKFTRTFQAKVEDLWPAALGPFVSPPAGWPHDQAGYALLTDALGERLDPLFVHWEPPSMRLPILRAVAGHHGRPPQEPDAALPRRVACPACIAAAGAFITAAFAVLDPPPLPALGTSDRHRLAWFLAGLAVLADWLGSARRWFPPVPAAAHADLGRYWHEIALPQAKRAVTAAGVLPAPVSPTSGLTRLFPAIAAPRPLQAWAETVSLPAGPTLFLVEDATGSGKTEAALVLAHRLMAADRGDGIFFALPTMATANAMHARLASAYRRLFAPGGRRPSLVLAHGRRVLNPDFTDSILDEAADPAAMPPEPADQPASAQCAAWIADDRRKVFLAEVGVGTIDQALLAVLPSRHAPLRLLGLARRVLIIDEAHAYDAYMFEELRRLLAFHTALGGSAILLSATLTAAQRRGLAQPFRSAPDEPDADGAEMAYPLATIVSASGTIATPIALAPELHRSVALERIADTEEAVGRIVAAAEAGVTVGWVRNAVDDAIEAAGMLRGRGFDPLLFHARFAMADRLAIEATVIERFGRASTPEERRGKIVVATQVIEQSLDLDFDLLVTDLAPADLVIQRAGRLWRHPGRARPPDLAARLLLLSPDPVPDPPKQWLGPELRRTGAVYLDHSLLWRSARALLTAGEIATPTGIRSLVEEVYNRDAPDGEPPGLSRATDRARGKWLAARGQAWQNLLSFDHPYERRAGLWEPDARTLTRLGDPQRTFRLAHLDRGRIVPWAEHEDSEHAWALSEVSVRAARLADAAPDPETDPLVAQIKQSWPAWDRDIPVLVLRPTLTETWCTAGVTQAGQLQPLVYDRRHGLAFSPPNPPATS